MKNPIYSLVALIWKCICRICEFIIALLRRAQMRVKELLLAALLLIVFSSLDKVQQFIFSFADDLKNGGIKFDSIFIILFNGLFVNWLCFVCWQKPIEVRKKINLTEAFRSYFIDQDSLSPLFTAWVATLPMLIINSSLTLSLLGYSDLTLTRKPLAYQEFLYDHSIIVTLFIVVFYALIAWILHTQNWILSLKKSYFFFGGCCLGSIFMLIFYHSFGSSIVIWLLLPLFIFLPSLSLCLMLYRISQELAKENKLSTAKTVKAATISSYAVSLFVLILTLFPSITTKIWFSNVFFPVVILLFIFIFYFQLIDFVTYNWKYGAVLLIVIWASAIFIGHKEHFELKETANNTYYKDPRITLEKYFDAWYADRKNSSSEQDSIPLYLVTAEGGGSRAGAWTTSILLKLDSSSSRNFSRHLFAISSVSGGSVGATTTLALWDQIKDNKDTLLYKDGRINSFVKETFKRNYISSSLGAMFFSDFFQQIPIISWLFTANSRSDRHQAEENDQLNHCLQKIFQLEPTNWHKKANYLNLYYSNKGNTINTSLPLYFANSTRVQDGRRTVISPVVGLLPNSAVDLLGLGALKKDTLVLQRLSIGQATNLSQLFPFISSSVYHERLGSFIDGGTFENMGLTTLSEVYSIIKHKIKTDSLRVKILVLPIYAYDNHDQDQKQLDDIKKPSQIFDPIGVLSQTPFAGHTDQVYHWMEKQTRNDGTTFLPIFMHKISSKVGPKVQEKLKIPVSRWLSSKELLFMLNKADLRTNQHLSKFKIKPKNS